MNPIMINIYLGIMTDRKLLCCILTQDTDFDLENEEYEQSNLVCIHFIFNS